MAEGCNHCCDGNLGVAYTAMANEHGASSSRRTMRADQLGADSAAMWAVALTSPTVNAAMGMRTATESGSGATRVWSNPPEGGGGTT